MTHWKLIWQGISTTKQITKEGLINLLNVYGPKLLQGISQFSTFNDNTYKEWAACNLTNTNSITRALLLRLCKLLNIGAEDGWNVLCNFLIYEYHGSVEEIQKIAQYEMQIIPLLEMIWQFYSFERMFIIKSLKYMLEFRNDKTHPHYEEFKNSINKLGKNNIRSSLMSQFKMLIHEISPNNQEDCSILKSWVQRNNAEILEIVHLLLLTADTPFFPEECLAIFKLFKEHAFGTQPSFFEALQYTNEITIRNTQNSEIALFILIINHYWKYEVDWLVNAPLFEKELIDMSENGDHSILLLCWVVLNMTLDEEHTMLKFKHYYSRYTQLAIRQNVFVKLNCLLNLEIFKNNAIGQMVYEATYNFLTHLIVAFQKCGATFLYEGIIDVAATLLKQKSLAVRCMNETNSSIGLQVILNHILEMFPVDFYSLTKVMESLCSHSCIVNMVVSGLCQLSAFTEKYGEYVPHLSLLEFEDVKIHQSYKPYNNDLVVFPERTSATIFRRYEEQFIRFHGSVSYFNIVIHHINMFMEQMSSGILAKDIDPSLVRSSLTLLRIIMETDYSLIENNPYLNKWENLIYDMLTKFVDIAYYDVELLGEILKIYTVRCHFRLKETQILLSGMNLIPNLGDLPITYENMHKVNILTYGTLLHHELQRKRKERSDQKILATYIDFLVTYWSLNTSYDKSHVEMPGFIILIRDVFPYFLSWKCNHENLRNTMTKTMLRLFIGILKKIPNDDTCADSNAMFDITLAYLHEYEHACLSLLQICSVGNMTLQTYMQNETDWENGPISETVTVTQLGLTLLMQLLTLRKYHTFHSEKTRLERHVYNHNSEDFKIVKVIAGYLTLPYNGVIPLLAARLLKKFTVKLELSLIAALNMEQEQVRLMLLQCLRDPCESTDMKVAIIELITTCIEKQHGMTIAFFDIEMLESTKKSTSVAESIVDYMAEYIRNTAKSTTYLYSPLFIAILNLFHMLWENHKEILLCDLVKEPHFWTAFSSPLFQELMLDNKSYAQLLNILTMEIYKTRHELNPNLLKVVIKFYDSKEKTMSVWMTHIKQSVKHKNEERKTLDEVPHWLLLLNAWKEFNAIVATIVSNDSMEIISDNLKRDLTKVARESLLEHLKQVDDNRVISLWADLYVVYLRVWEEQPFFNEECIVQDFIHILQHVADIYHELPKRCQDALLTMIYKSIQCFKPHLQRDPSLTFQLLEPGYSRILNFEYDSFDKSKKAMLDENGQIKKNPHGSFVLCLSTINTVLELRSCDGLRGWFIHNQYIKKLTNCVTTFAINSNLYFITQIALEGLNLYARSEMAKDFMLMDLQNEFFPQIRPKKEFQYLGKTGFNKTILWEVREWWVVYTKVFTFNLTLMGKHGDLMLEEFLSFLTVHEQVIIDTLQLIKFTVDVHLLDLIICMLLFIKRLLRYRERWYHAYGQIFNTIMESGVQYLINGAIGILLRPKVLRNLTEMENFENRKPMDQISVELMDKLIDVITLSTFCYLEYSPKLIDLIKSIDDIPKYPLLLVSDFRVPKVNLEAECQLTYGSLLCTVHLYIKALQQMCLKKRTPGSRREILTARKRTESVQSSEYEKQLTAVSPTVTNLAEGSKDFKRIRKIPSTITQGTSEYPMTAITTLLTNINAYKLNSIQTFASSSTSGMCAPWLARLNEQKIYRSLEAVMTLVAEQAVLTLNDTAVDRKDMQFIRRELFSELQIFHEFVKKRLVDLYRYNAMEKTVLLRKKFGTNLYVAASDHKFKHLINRQLTARTVENVLTDWTFDVIANEISTIQSGENSKRASRSDNTNELDTPMLYSGLNEVKIVDEDYVHMLSNWFINTCQLHH